MDSPEPDPVAVSTVRRVSPEPFHRSPPDLAVSPARAPELVRGPQADRDLLALHALRQRQLRTAFLHGSRRNWRDTRRIWPAVVVAVVIVGLAVAAISVLAALHV